MQVGIVGGGMTGLATLHELRERGIDAVLFEAESEPGGVIQSGRRAGTVLEYGPQRLRASGVVKSYLDTVDLLDELIEAKADAPIYVYGEGQLRRVPFDPWTMVRTDLLSLRGKVRLLLEPVTGPARENETVAEYFTRKLGNEAYRRGIEPLFGGLYGSDPAAMPVHVALDPIIGQENGRGILTRLAFRRLRSDGSRPPAAVPRQGMQALPRRLAERHVDDVHLDSPVERISSTADGYHLTTPSGTTSVDHVVVTTDAPTAASLTASVDTAVSSHLEELTYNPLVLVYLRAPLDREGLGFQVQRTEPVHTLGVAWNGIAFDRDQLHTAFLGGMHDPDLVHASDERLQTIAATEFEEMLGVTPDPVGVHRLTPGMPAYDHSWHHREALDPPSGLHLAGSYTSRVGIPGRMRQGKRIADRLAQME